MPTLRFSPFLLPSPSGYAYFILNFISYYATIAGCSVLLFGGKSTDGLIIIPIAAATVVVTTIQYANRCYAKHSQKIPAEQSRQLRGIFLDFSHDVEFLSRPNGDARALQLKNTNYCILHPNQIFNITDGDVERDKQQSKFVVAHELAHIASGDTHDLVRATFSASLAIFTGMAVFIAMLMGHLEFTVKPVLGLLYLSLAYFFLIHWVLRIREFYADKIAGIIIGPENAVGVLSRSARIAKFLKFSWKYFLTHPSPSARERVFENFKEIYQYSWVKVFLSAFVLSAMFFVGPLAASGVSRNINLTNIGLGSMPGFVLLSCLVVFGIWFQYYVIYQNVVPGALLNELSLLKLSLRCIVLCIFGLLNAEIICGLFADREFIQFVSPTIAPGGTWAMFGGLLFTHWTYYIMARELSKYDGPKQLPSRLGRKLFWRGAVISFLFLMLGVASVTFAITTPSSQESIGYFVLCLAITFLIVLTYWSWRWSVRRSLRAKKLGRVRRHATFVSSEWEPHGELTTGARRPAFLIRSSGYIAIYAFGFYLITLIGAIIQPDDFFLSQGPHDEVWTQNVVMAHLSRDAAYGLTWTILFIYILLKSRRSGGLFPPVKRVGMVR